MKFTHTLFVCLAIVTLPMVAQRRGESDAFPEARSGEKAEKTMFPEVRALHAMVGGGNNFVVEAGLRILGEGGNAVDAGVATSSRRGSYRRRPLQHGRGNAGPHQNERPAGARVISGIGTAPAKATGRVLQEPSHGTLETPDPQASRFPHRVSSPPLHRECSTARCWRSEKFGTMTFAKVRGAHASNSRTASPTTGSVGRYFAP